MQENTEPKEKEERNAKKEADVKKSIIPLDERMTMFTQLLREKQVNNLVVFFFFFAKIHLNAPLSQKSFFFTCMNSNAISDDWLNLDTKCNTPFSSKFSPL